MSVKETNKIDGMGIEENTNSLVFLIADPYAWELDEYDHLKTMQTKINNCPVLGFGIIAVDSRRCDAVSA